tara:strand:+ start:4877 stop:5020 length:144 start_codon:yes stop_codon:yes gene_type:complete
MEMMTYVLGITALIGLIQLVVLTKRYSAYFIDEKLKERESRLDEADP